MDSFSQAAALPAITLPLLLLLLIILDDIISILYYKNRGKDIKWTELKTIVSLTWVMFFIFSPIRIIYSILPYRAGVLDFFKNTSLKNKIMAIIISVLSTMASVYTIASYYKTPKAGGVKIEETAKEKEYSYKRPIPIGMEKDIYIEQEEKIDSEKLIHTTLFSIMKNPINFSFFIIMMVLFIINIHTYNTEKYKDFKSSISSIGILGTFLGLFIGLLEFDASNIDESIMLLLDGLKIAFFTSVIGISLSTFLTIYETIKSE